MTVVFDRREELAGRPALHALLVGVSRYRHLSGGGGEPARHTFGLKSLSSAALTAYRLRRWLVDNADHLAAPLGTCRLLVAPVDRELETAPELGDVSAGATLNDFVRAVGEWRADARDNPSSIALLYFVGHGIERPDGEQLLILEDFGDGIGPVLRNTVGLSTVVAGMAPSRRQENIARTQVYVFDASRRRPRDDLAFNWVNATPAFDPEDFGVDDRALLTIYAAAPGSPAFAQRSSGSLLGQGLIRSLEGSAAEPIEHQGREQWTVTLASLARALPQEVAELARQQGVEQLVVTAGSLQDVALVKLATPPAVETELSIQLGDGEAAVVELRDHAGELAFTRHVSAADPVVRARLPAGMYIVSVTYEGPAGALPPRAVLVRPPATRLAIEPARV